MSSTGLNETLIQAQQQISQIPKLNLTSCTLVKVCQELCTIVQLDMYSINDSSIL